MTINRIVFTCGTCHKPITEGYAWVHVDMEEINHVESELRDQGLYSGGGFSGTLGDLLAREDTEGPELPPAPDGRTVPWTPVHDACATYDQRGPYGLDIDSINTRERLAGESKRLREGKAWLRLTDWDDFERRALAQLGD